MGWNSCAAQGGTVGRDGIFQKTAACRFHAVLMVVLVYIYRNWQQYFYSLPPGDTTCRTYYVQSRDPLWMALKLPKEFV